MSYSGLGATTTPAPDVTCPTGTVLQAGGVCKQLTATDKAAMFWSASTTNKVVVVGVAALLVGALGIVVHELTETHEKATPNRRRFRSNAKHGRRSARNTYAEWAEMLAMRPATKAMLTQLEQDRLRGALSTDQFIILSMRLEGLLRPTPNRRRYDSTGRVRKPRRVEVVVRYDSPQHHKTRLFGSTNERWLTQGHQVIVSMSLGDYRKYQRLVGGNLGTYAPNSRLCGRRTDLRSLGLKMHNWHSSMGDPLYAVGSYFVGGDDYPDRDVVVRALDEVESLMRREKSRTNLRELRSIHAGLRRYLSGRGRVSPNRRRRR